MSEKNPATSPRRPRRLLSWLIGSLAIAIVVAGLVFAFFLVRPAQERVISGRVTCLSGKTVVGVWVAQDNDAPGKWAEFRVSEGLPDSSADYTAVIRTDRYALHVGCGGTPKVWGTSNNTPFVSGDQNDFMCHDMLTDPRHNICVQQNR